MTIVLAGWSGLFAHAADPPRDVHITTFNVQMLVYPEATDDDYFTPSGDPISNVERAELIADRILHSDAEIVALQEVFDEDARDRLVEDLAPAYPFYVSYLGNDKDLSDSGLMLFSAFPFEEMALADTYQRDCGDVEVGAAGEVYDCPKSLVGFVEWDCSIVTGQADCLAAKGAGLVRIALPMGESLLVAFTHFRASYADDIGLSELLFQDPEVIGCAKASERREALARIGDLVNDAVEEVEGSASRAKIAVVGDLDLDGNPFHSDGSACLDDEWDDAFSSTSIVPFSGCAELDAGTCEDEDRVMVDAWAFTTSPDDLGRTAGFPLVTDLSDPELMSEGKRLDYMLIRGPIDPAFVDGMVPQHLTIDGSLTGETAWASDHLPIAMDLLLPGPDRAVTHSTPADAALLDVPALGSADVDLEVELPGQVQWARMVGEPGTYTLRASTDEVNVDIYAAYDLSRPIRPRRELTGREGGAVYLLNHPPYFVRTADPDRTATVSYTLTATEHRCTSPDDACILTAGDLATPATATWAPNVPSNPEDALYFLFYADTPDVQKSEAYHVFQIVGDTKDLPKLELEILDSDDLLPVDDVSWGDLAIDGARLTRRADHVRGSLSGHPSFDDHLLRVTRPDLQWGDTIRVFHQTNLTYFHPLTVEVLQEEDDSAHDELLMYIDPAPTDPFHATVAEDEVYLHIGAFVALPPIDEAEDHGSPWTASPFLPSHRLTEPLPLLMVEDDDEDDKPKPGDYRFAEPQPPAGQGLSTDDGRAFAGLPLDRPRARVRWLFTDDPDAEDDDTDYRYRFTFDASHTPPELD